jgi:hypothetical protein
LRIAAARGAGEFEHTAYVDQKQQRLATAYMQSDGYAALQYTVSNLLRQRADVVGGNPLGWSKGRYSLKDSPTASVNGIGPGPLSLSLSLCATPG